MPQALHRPGGGERLAGVEVGMVGPAHSLGEVIISSAEVGRPREQSESPASRGSISFARDNVVKASPHRRRW